MTKETADVINNFEAGRLYEKALKAIPSEPIKEAEEDLTQKEGKMATEARCYTAGFEDGGKVS